MTFTTPAITSTLVLRDNHKRDLRALADLLADTAKAIALSFAHGPAVYRHDRTITVPQPEQRLTERLCQFSGVAFRPKTLHFNADRTT